MKTILLRSASLVPFLVAVLVTLVAFGSASKLAVANDLPHADNGPSQLFFKENKACLVPPNCQIPASAVFPNPNDYTVLATLTVPDGSYLVTSKLSAFAANGTNYVNFECALIDGWSGNRLDMSSFDGTAEHTLFLQAPVSFNTGSGGNIKIGCRAHGFQPNGSLVDMHVWNVNIAAMKVRSVTIE
jgi:hypothetical protein